MKIDQEQMLERLLKFLMQDFKLAMTGAEEGSEALTPMDVLAKRMELAGVGEKVTVSLALSIVRSGNPEKPQVSLKASCTLKGTSATGDYQELPFGEESEE